MMPKTLAAGFDIFSLLLIGLGVGYIVCIFAKKQDGFLKSLGYLLGTVILISSMILLICNIAIRANMIAKRPVDKNYDSFFKNMEKYKSSMEQLQKQSVPQEQNKQDLAQ